SVYNDGKGIQISLSFTPLPLPIRTGPKKRKNAKPVVENRVFYLHENVSLGELLDAFIEHTNTSTKALAYTIGNRTGVLSPYNFTIKYTIPRTAYKEVILERETDMTGIINEVTKQRSPSIKLFVVEQKKLVIGKRYSPSDFSESDTDADSGDNRWQNAGPTAEEIRQNELIASLVRRYTCEDKSCKFMTCWPAPPDATHVHLTPLHLNTWAAAMV
ncbi:hypothetical protein BV22DRAFT_998425, partial [Leucogyrophana mollusca]